MTRGFPLFLVVIALTAGTLAMPTRGLQVACLAGLVVVWLLTPAGGDK